VKIALIIPAPKYPLPPLWEAEAVEGAAVVAEAGVAAAALQQAAGPGQEAFYRQQPVQMPSE